MSNNIAQVVKFFNLRAALLAALAVPFVGCGQTAFNVLATIQHQPNPGYAVIPPKVDILLFVDDTGSMTSAYSTIATQVPQFLSQLQSQNWDYHFASNPLTTPRNKIPQVAGSIYDSNSPGWTPPYPGAPYGGSENIISSFFRSPSTYTDFLTQAQVNTNLGGAEPGFSTIQSTLNTSIQGTGFLRPDSLLVLIVMGNGDDTSGLSLCDRGDGFMTSCSGSNPTNISTYQRAFSTVHVGSSPANPVRFYAVENLNGTSSCLGDTGPAIQSTRYSLMATALGGQSYDICSQSIGATLAGVSGNLTSTQLAYQTRYLILSGPPNLSSVVVTKYIGGNTNSSKNIPQSSSDGWTYAGYINNQGVNQLVGPTGTTAFMNNATGYAIQLHGSAMLSGNDTASVKFTPYGAANSETY